MPDFYPRGFCYQFWAGSQKTVLSLFHISAKMHQLVSKKEKHVFTELSSFFEKQPRASTRLRLRLLWTRNKLLQLHFQPLRWKHLFCRIERCQRRKQVEATNWGGSQMMLHQHQLLIVLLVSDIISLKRFTPLKKMFSSIKMRHISSGTSTAHPMFSLLLMEPNYNWQNN